MGTPNSNQHNLFFYTAPNCKSSKQKRISIMGTPDSNQHNPLCHTAPNCKSCKQKRISSMGTPNCNQHNPLCHTEPNCKSSKQKLIWEHPTPKTSNMGTPTPTSTTPFVTQHPTANQANKSISLLWEPPTPTSTIYFVTQHQPANQANKSVSLIWEHPTPKTSRTPDSHSTQLKTSKQKRISNMGIPNSNQHNPVFAQHRNASQANKSVSLIWEPPTPTSTIYFVTQHPTANQANKSVSLIWEPPTQTSTTPLSHSTQLQIKQTKAYL